MFLIFWSICWWPETNQNMFQNRLLVACVSSIGPLARSDYHRTDRLGEQVLELIDMKHCHLELLRWEYHIRKCYGKLFSSSSSSCTIGIFDRNIAKGTTDPRVEFSLPKSLVYVISMFIKFKKKTWSRLSSESRRSINFKILTKHQYLD